MSRSAAASRGSAPAALAVAVLLLALCLLGCGPAAPVGPLGFSLDYSTGSIPPPYNYHYTIDVVLEDQRAQVTYQLEYLYRNDMSEAELRELGYTPEDDIRWSGQFSQEDAERWFEIARTSALTGKGEPAPGADSMLIRVSHTEGTFRAGTPVDRAPWQQIAREVDRAAREELDTERAQP